MSTARNRDAYSDKFLALAAGLHLSEVGGDLFDPLDELSRCLKAHQFIWALAEEEIFTEHGTPHSYFVLEYLLRLEPIAKWSPYEGVVLAMAALVHDIGMQFNRWGQLAADDSGTEVIAEVLLLRKPPRDVDEIREEHIPLGSALISAELDRTSSWASQFAFCSGTDHALSVLGLAHTVAFAHSDGIGWEALRNASADYVNDRSWPGPPRQTIRPRLMAGFFRLADELHCDFTRAPDIAQLWQDRVPEKSRSHWVAAACTHSMDLTVISAETRRVDATLRWRKPRNITAQMREDITRLLLRSRMEKLTDAFRAINEMFEVSRHGHLRIYPQTHFEPDPVEEFTIDINDRLRTLLTEQALVASPEGDPRGVTDAPITGAALRAKVAVFVTDMPSPLSDLEESLAATGQLTSDLDIERMTDASQPLDVATGPSTAIEGTGPYPETLTDDNLETTMREWLNTHSEPGHWRVSRGAHTNRLVRLRALMADRDLLIAITHRVRRIAETRQVASILGVGTSCIPIVARLSLQLSLPVTFTTHETTEGARGYQGIVDRTPIIDFGGEGKVLILDDLVAQGVTAHNLIERLEEHGVDPSRIVYVALFHLSSVPLIPNPGVPLLSICDVPEVYYVAASDVPSKCALCIRGDRIVNEVDVW